MKIAVYAKSLVGLGGGAKYGLLLLEPLIGLHEIVLFHGPGGGVDRRILVELFGFDLPGVRLAELESERSLTRITRGFDLFLNITYASLARGGAARNVLLVFFPLPLDDVGVRPLRERIDQSLQRGRTILLEWIDGLDPGLGLAGMAEYRGRRGLAATLLRLPLFALRKVGWMKPDSYRLGFPALDSYDLIVAISSYTADWIRTYFGRESLLHYPPIDVERFIPGDKEPVVLSVGRFEAGEMSKKHDILMAVFKRLYDEGVLEGWQLRICGGSDGSPDFEEQVEKLRREARGYPIVVSVNLPFAELRDLYGKASLYWHAMGFGQDISRHPWRYEHFGMSTVEAMSAGCVPMVIAAGGQAEIVSDGKNGYLWDTTDALEDQTRRFLTLDPESVQRMRVAARDRACEFSWDHFVGRTAAIYRSLNVDCRVASESELVAAG